MHCHYSLLQYADLKLLMLEDNSGNHIVLLLKSWEVWLCLVWWLSGLNCQVNGFEAPRLNSRLSGLHF